MNLCMFCGACVEVSGELCEKCNQYVPNSWEILEEFNKRQLVQICPETAKWEYDWIKFIRSVGTNLRAGLRHSRKGKGMECTITIYELLNLWKAQDGICVYTGWKMAIEKGKLRTASIDRIDSTRGYTIDNVQWVCWVINDLRGSMESEDFVLLCQAVAHFYEYRKALIPPDLIVTPLISNGEMKKHMSLAIPWKVFKRVQELYTTLVDLCGDEMYYRDGVRALSKIVNKDRHTVGKYLEYLEQFGMIERIYRGGGCPHLILLDGESK